jgi:hypothetical protein
MLIWKMYLTLFLLKKKTQAIAEIMNCFKIKAAWKQTKGTFKIYMAQAFGKSTSFVP